MVLKATKYVINANVKDLILHALVVPGGGSQTEAGNPNTLPIWVKKRLNLAYTIWLQNEFDNKPTLPILLLSCGTMYKPGVLDVRGYNFRETTSMALYLESLGMDMAYVLEETCSYDTIGNAFFCRIMFTDIYRWTNLLIIGPDFHIKRIKKIFEWIYSLNGPLEYKLYFLSV